MTGGIAMQSIYGAIRDITESIFSSVLGLSIYETDAARLATGVSTLGGRVRITGAFEGSVALHCSDGLARRAASIMFATPDAGPEDAQEVIAELANMAGGNIKALMAEPSELSLPAVAEGTDLVDRVPGSRLVTAVSFECSGEPLVVSLLERAS
jgi:chemotaxis protein CheX